MTRPTRSTTAGRAYLDLQRLARRTGEPTDELLTRFVLERFIYRLARSAHRERFVLKGGMLLEVFDVRRPTRDIDIQGRGIAGDVETISAVVREIAAEQVDDGIVWLTDRLTAAILREDAPYGSIRVRMPAELDRARTILSLDVSIGDPIVPGPVTIRYPTLLGGETFEIQGYALETVLAEKLETMIRRGGANTRERDFADVWLLLRRHEIDGDEMTAALLATAAYRETGLVSLLEAVGNLPAVRQAAWSAYRTRSRVDVPEDFGRVLDEIANFVDPVVMGAVGGFVWNMSEQTWSIGF